MTSSDRHLSTRIEHGRAADGQMPSRAPRARLEEYVLLFQMSSFSTSMLVALAHHATCSSIMYDAPPWSLEQQVLTIPLGALGQCELLRGPHRRAMTHLDRAWAEQLAHEVSPASAIQLECTHALRSGSRVLTRVRRPHPK